MVPEPTLQNRRRPGTRFTLSGLRLPGARGTRAGRPMKWTDERSGSFMSDYHSGDHEDHGRARRNEIRVMALTLLTQAGPDSSPDPRDQSLATRR
jgi:hypothetical protein